MDIINSPLFILSIFTVIVIIGMYAIHTFNVPADRKFELLVTYFGGISVILISYNIYINIQSNDRIEKNRTAYNTLTNIQRNYLQPQKELVDHYPEGFFLYASMNQDTDLQQTEPKEYDPIKRSIVETYESLRVFQAMEDFLSTAAYDITGMYVWINNFLMWMQSPTLRHYWTLLNFNYADDTRALVERIIKKSDELIELRKKKGQLTPQDYDAIAKNFKVAYR